VTFLSETVFLGDNPSYWH